MKLTEEGDVDYSTCTNENVRQKFEHDPRVKMYLMLRDLKFEFPHRERLVREMQEYKYKLDKLNKNRNRDDPLEEV